MRIFAQIIYQETALGQKIFEKIATTCLRTCKKTDKRKENSTTSLFLEKSVLWFDWLFLAKDLRDMSIFLQFLSFNANLKIDFLFASRYIWGSRSSTNAQNGIWHLKTVTGNRMNVAWWCALICLYIQL